MNNPEHMKKEGQIQGRDGRMKEGGQTAGIQSALHEAGLRIYTNR